MKYSLSKVVSVLVFFLALNSLVIGAPSIKTPQTTALDARSCSSDKDFKKHGGFCQTYTWSGKEKEENLRKFLEGQEEAARKHQSETVHDSTLEKRSCSSDKSYKEHGGFCQTYTWSEKEKEENLRKFLEGQEAARKKHAEAQESQP